MGTCKAHLSIVQMNISAYAKTTFVGSNTGPMFPRQAYTTLPYIRTLLTRELISYSFTLMLEMPSSRQFVLTAQNVFLALHILALSNTSGLNDVLDIIKPRYLNSFAVSIFYWFISISPVQFTNIACVFSILMCRSLATQKD